MNKKFQDLLKSYMQSRDLTIESLALRAGIATSTVANLLRSGGSPDKTTRNPHFRTTKALAQALDLLEGTPAYIDFVYIATGLEPPLRPFAPPEKPQYEIVRLQLRDDLQAALARRNGFHCITGLPGIGKSTLAASVVHRLYEQDHDLFSGGIVTVECRSCFGRAGYVTVLDKLLQLWNVPLAPEQLVGNQTIDQFIAAQLRNLQGVWKANAPILIYLDNIEQDFPLAHFLTFVRQFRITCLLTSNWTFGIADLIHHPVSELTEDEAFMLLRDVFRANNGHWNNVRDVAIAREIVKSLAKLPLVISMKAETAALQAMIMQDVLDEMGSSDHPPGDENTDPVLDSFRVATRALSGADRDCLTLLGVLDLDWYPRPVILRLFATQTVDPQITLSNLIRHSLMHAERMTNYVRMRMHPSFLPFAATVLLKEKGDGTHAIETDVVRTICNYAHELHDDIKTLAQMEDLFTTVINFAWQRGSWNRDLLQLIEALDEMYGYNGSWMRYQNLLEMRLVIAEKLQDQSEIGRAHNRLGLLAWKKSAYDEGLYHFRTALEIDKESGNLQHVSLNLMNLGNIVSDQGKYIEAEEFYREALQNAQVIADGALTARIIRNMAILFEDMGRYPDAEAYYQQALDLTKRYLKLIDYGSMQNDFGIFYWQIGRFAEALSYEQQALTIARAEQHKDVEAHVLHSLGELYLSLADVHVDEQTRYFELARRALEEADGIARDLEELGVQAQVALVQGKLHLRQRLLDDAEVDYQRAYDLAEDIRDELWITYALVGLANVRRDQGKADEAVDYYEEASQHLPMLDNKIIHAEYWLNLGLYFVRTSRGSSRQCWQKALEYVAPLNHALVPKIEQLLRDHPDPLDSG